MSIMNRKSQHLRICSEEDVWCRWNPWDDVIIPHRALPELNMDELDLSATFLKSRLSAPVMVAAMTGGCPEAKDINENLARAAADLGIGMGVGSQRAALEDPRWERTYSVVKEYDVPFVLGNVGSPQLIEQGDERPYGLEDVERARDMVGAHAVALHFNFLQEVVQPEGEPRGKGVIDALRPIASKVPIVVKETGAGLDGVSATVLKDAGCAALDVGGMGGTSFAAVEVYRARSSGDDALGRLGDTYWNWGNPTPYSVRDCQVGLPLIATGGLRNGLDALRSLTIGADMAGYAGAVLPNAIKGYKQSRHFLETIIRELRAGMLLVGAGNVDALSDVRFGFSGKLRDWERLL